MITVALVDDHMVTRTGIKTVLELNNQIIVSIQASNGFELKQLLEAGEQPPDVIILDVSMPVMNGVETIEYLKKNYPSVYVLIFSIMYEEDTVIDMITRGASGYISKSSDPAKLAAAVLSVYNKGFYLGELVKKKYFKKQSTVKARRGFLGKNSLTAKEVAFIRLAASNLNYTEIANQLEVRPKTVENYRDSVFQKLGLNNRAALIVYAFKTGIIDIFH